MGHILQIRYMCRTAGKMRCIYWQTAVNIPPSCLDVLCSRVRVKCRCIYSPRCTPYTVESVTQVTNGILGIHTESGLLRAYGLEQQYTQYNTDYTSATYSVQTVAELVSILQPVGQVRLDRQPQPSTCCLCINSKPTCSQTEPDLLDGHRCRNRHHRCLHP